MAKKRRKESRGMEKILFLLTVIVVLSLIVDLLSLNVLYEIKKSSSDLEGELAELWYYYGPPIEQPGQPGRFRCPSGRDEVCPGGGDLFCEDIGYEGKEDVIYYVCVDGWCDMRIWEECGIYEECAESEGGFAWCKELDWYQRSYY